jgi:hypothetical protein
MQPNQEYIAKNADIPPFMLYFSADASVVTAAAQNVPPSGTVTSTTGTRGIVSGRNTSVISRARVRFVGDAANVGGQTIQLAVLVNGVAIATAILATPLATTAGVKSGTVDFTPTTLAEGDVVRVTLTPSALLTAVVTDASVTLS